MGRQANFTVCKIAGGAFMNENLPVNTMSSTLKDGNLIGILSNLDKQTVLLLGGMFCVTTITCIGFVSLSGSEMSVNLKGLTISQPKSLQ